MKEYNNDGRLKVYLAGPFFNEEQEERITFLEDILEMYDYDIFSPRKASRITPNCTSQDMIDTFNGNVSHIDDADFVLAVADGNDTGTMFECGYAYAIKKPVLYFNETREKGPNLMLAMSGALPFITKTTNITDIMKFLTSITTILAIPTLVASLWGMNVPVPFQNYQYGFPVLLAVSFVVTLTVMIWLKKRNMLN